LPGENRKRLVSNQIKSFHLISERHKNLDSMSIPGGSFARGIEPAGHDLVERIDHLDSLVFPLAMPNRWSVPPRPTCHEWTGST
jgi:hypothetical protein